MLLHEHFGLSRGQVLPVDGQFLLKTEVEGVEVKIESEVLGEGVVLPV